MAHPVRERTVLTKAIAEASNAHLISFTGPEIESKWVGQSESNLREKFKEAERNEPAIIFIDEIDSITQKREDLSSYGRQLVAQLLGLMDGLTKRKRVIVIGTTNMPDSIDPALRRPGRFDRELKIGMPNKKHRLDILKIHTKGLSLDDKVDLEKIAEITNGYTGADLAHLCQEATLKALLRVKPILDIDGDIDGHSSSSPSRRF